MKQYKLLLSILVFTFIAGGCDYLEYDESSYLKKEEVLDEFSRVQKMLTQVYSQLPHGFGTVDGAMRSCGTDDAVQVNNISNVVRFTDGTWSATQTIDTQWEAMYSGIYQANLFLSSIENKNWDNLKWNDNYNELMEQYVLYQYEARFLRAYFYFELLRRYGGVPLIKSELSAEEANKVERASTQEVADFIIAECNVAISELPVTFDGFSNNSETGRATKGAAMALKARTLLYMASPLFNASGDVSKWSEAADAANDIIALDSYTLEGDYSKVVNNGKSKELIFGVRQAESVDFEKKNFPIGYEGGNTGTCPSLNLVNAYEMVDSGLAIDDENSGYDANSPYVGRDPRLNMTVILNGSTWKGKVIGVWYGGPNAAPKPNATRTGFYLKKYVIESVNLNPVSKKRHEWVLFRLGEVYLNLAEALNEAQGGPEIADDLGMTALQAVNMVRQRAGMPDFPTGMSQDEFRNKLRNERRVELAFEDHRFWDIRRWMIGAETTEIKGIVAKLNPFGGYVYEEKDVETRVWDEKMNWYPIPQSEIYKNSKLGQNPGW
ncbi:RagB/SusD family nutrient uptake outer membrane protein [Puteibacter caeruleilacunae]|nr:RagB/SusD family nutrient uptake outer membrane protein [Puteibacter caeruleilacunae]